MEWAALVSNTSLDSGDIYRLLRRTVELLKQVSYICMVYSLLYTLYLVVRHLSADAPHCRAAQAGLLYFLLATLYFIVGSPSATACAAPSSCSSGYRCSYALCSILCTFVLYTWYSSRSTRSARGAPKTSRPPRTRSGATTATPTG